jgi:hypothetical protein
MRDDEDYTDDEWPEFLTDPNLWAEPTVFPASIQEKQRLALEDLAKQKYIKLDYQKSGNWHLYRVFGRPSSISDIEYIFSDGEYLELCFESPVDLDPMFPHYNPHETFSLNSDGNFEQSLEIDGILCKRILIGLNDYGRLKRNVIV